MNKTFIYGCCCVLMFKNRLKTYLFRPAKKLFDSELHFFFLVIISPLEQWSLQ